MHSVRNCKMCPLQSEVLSFLIHHIIECLQALINLPLKLSTPFLLDLVSIILLNERVNINFSILSFNRWRYHRYVLWRYRLAAAVLRLLRFIILRYYSLIIIIF